MTSHDVVARVRRLARQRTGTKKVGHTGTLDPLATGVLILCLGQATKLSNYVMASRKGYRAEVLFGVETDSFDADGEIVATREAVHLTCTQIEDALPEFRGDIAQIPPKFSAIKQGGKKLYELARAGEHVEIEARSVTIHRLAMVACDPPTCRLEIECSTGTYIRSIAHDLGQALGVGGHLTGLERTFNGGFHIEQAVTLDELESIEDWTPFLVDPLHALRDYPAVTLTAEQQVAVQQGQFIERSENASQGVMMGYTESGRLLAILEPRAVHLWKPRKVFPVD